MSKIIVSACLVGKNCRYDGGNCYNNKLIEFLKSKEYIAACPEELGGLSTPRLPCEREEDKVFNKANEDVTTEFNSGANEFLQLALANSCKLAILKSDSPSCGKGIIYDGSFSGKLTAGNGVTTQLLLKHGIKVITEKEL